MNILHYTCAIGWSIWARYRGLLPAMVVYLLVSAIAVRMLPVDEDSIVTKLVVAPAAAVLIMLVVIFTMTEAGTRSKPRAEGFPARMFTLPVRTSSLVGASMLSGVTSIVLVWLAIAWLVLRPCGLPVPLFLPALALAATLAFFQAVAWVQFIPVLIRAPVVIVLAPALVAAPIWAVETYGFRPVLYWLVFPCYLAAAYAVAVVGVARERRGDSDAGLPRILDRLADRVRARTQPFHSADRAQLWFEWRGCGHVYPGFVVLLLIPILIVVACLGKPDAVVAGFTLALIVFFLGFLSALIGGCLAKTQFQAGESWLSPFTLTRPMSSGRLVAAKLKTAALSALAGWAIVALVLPPFLALMGYGGPLAMLLGQLLADRSLLVAAIVLTLLAGAVLVMTWNGLVGGLAIGLTGRPWIGGAYILVIYFAVGIAGWLGHWLRGHPELARLFATALPWLLGLAVVIKGSAAWWALFTASRRGHIATRTLWGGLGLWLASAAGLCMLLWLLLPTSTKSVWLILSAVFLSLPLARLAAAPLALDWQRHR